jgi:hypothetical protein
MDLFRDIKKGKFGNNPKLKREAKHEVKELGGEKVAEAHEKKVEMAKKMKPNPKGVMERNNKIALEIDKHNRSWNGKKYTY